jgi:hypothetical protein
MYAMLRDERIVDYDGLAPGSLETRDEPIVDELVVGTRH